MKHSPTAALLLFAMLSPCFVLYSCANFTHARPNPTTEISHVEPTAVPVDAPVEIPAEEPVDDAYLHTDISLVDTADAASTETDLIYNPPEENPRNPIIKVYKSKRRLELLDGDTLIGRFPIGLGFSPEGDKAAEGDGKTPVGEYYICMRNPNSRYYRSLGLSYPSTKDAQRALDSGTIGRTTYQQITDAIVTKQRPPWNTPLGGEIFIHGHGSLTDWTLGCIALDDCDMDILFECCPLQTQVLIFE